ncbi:solute carrier family 22 member 3-like [Penaeus indicus]|uniref:solute carrier family 22 member 3-like n=1 Tax=Penaeus indicus TaxID=29960 RepID=UPI00300D2FDE
MREHRQVISPVTVIVLADALRKKNSPISPVLDMAQQTASFRKATGFDFPRAEGRFEFLSSPPDGLSLASNKCLLHDYRVFISGDSGRPPSACTPSFPPCPLTISGHPSVSQWGLVCERVWIKRWVSTSYLFGLVIGGLLFGFLADRFGRRNLLVVSIATVGCLGVALHFVRRLIVFLSLRFIQSIFIQYMFLPAQGVFVTSWALVGELFPPKWRCRALVAAAMARPLGVAMGALTALFVQHWRAVQLAVSLPLLISLMYCCQSGCDIFQIYFT